MLCRNTFVGEDSRGVSPTYRVTGLLLNFEFKYYNYKNVRAPPQFCNSPFVSHQWSPGRVTCPAGSEQPRVQTIAVL